MGLNKLFRKYVKIYSDISLLVQQVLLRRSSPEMVELIKIYNNKAVTDVKTDTVLTVADYYYHSTAVVIACNKFEILVIQLCRVCKYEKL